MTTIPLMTNPLGKYWDQPELSEIVVDDKTALMSQTAFEKLKDYSHSIPSGVYAGKMWKSKRGGRWVLRWYQEIPDNDKELDIISREILIIEK